MRHSKSGQPSPAGSRQLTRKACGDECESDAYLHEHHRI